MTEPTSKTQYRKTNPEISIFKDNNFIRNTYLIEIGIVITETRYLKSKIKL